MERSIQLGTLDYFGTVEIHLKAVPVLEEHMPAEGDFPDIVFYFDSKMYDSGFFVRFAADKSLPENMRRVFAGGIFPDGSGRVKKRCIFTGTKDSIIDFIRSDMGKGFIVDTIVNMDNEIRKTMEAEMNADQG